MKASGRPDVVEAVLRDHRTAPIDERLRATLTFLEKAVTAPDALRAADADEARAGGGSDRALEDAA
ncbi:MAG: hypothetical protein JOZ75_04200, partial [Candidatus Dormibacteraeota bacterium]|nr:hypothetical protein [Candidatus Dormibacteraeota bacterium]